MTLDHVTGDDSRSDDTIRLAERDLLRRNCIDTGNVLLDGYERTGRHLHYNRTTRLPNGSKAVAWTEANHHWAWRLITEPVDITLTEYP